MSTYHISVLKQEVIAGLEVQNNKKYVDATLGGAGHTEEILKHGGKVLGIDQDNDALSYVAKELKDAIDSGRLVICKGNFNNLKTIAKEYGFTEVAGILFDLGVSSHQFDDPTRGFSFQYDSPLDMRMDTSLSVSAADLVNGLTKSELAELFVRYGEEKFAHRIAHNIEKARKKQKIVTTGELADIVARSYPIKGRNHPATKVFQALRIAVNDELHALSFALPQAIELLEEKGRLVVITFHSLEDRIVKNSFIEFEKKGQGKIITQKPIQPSEEEINNNWKSRSAKMRIFEKL